jgi:hypothetical protein
MCVGEGYEYDSIKKSFSFIDFEKSLPNVYYGQF